jgi:carbon storage regulator
MLVLSRKTDQSIVIGENIVVRVLRVRGGKVRLGIEAPRDVSVHRSEVYLAAGTSEMEPASDPPPQPLWACESQ